MVREVTRGAYGVRVDFAKESIARDHNFARVGILVYLKRFQLHPTKSAVDFLFKYDINSLDSVLEKTT